MFLHIGEDVVVPLKDIVAILDMRLNKAEATKEFLQIVTDEGFVEVADRKGTIPPEKLKTFVITANDDENINKVYYTSISSTTLVKRTLDITSKPKIKKAMANKRKKSMIKRETKA